MLNLYVNKGLFLIWPDLFRQANTAKVNMITRPEYSIIYSYRRIKMHKRSKTMLALLTLLVLAFPLFAGGKQEGTKDDRLRFAFLPNTQNNTFQSTMNDTFKTLCDEKGIAYTVLDPDYDLNKQLNQLSDAANQKYDMVFVIPVDSNGITAGLMELKQAGVPVINVDTSVGKDDLSLVLSVVATDAYMAGTLVGAQMVEDYPEGGKIAILDFPSNESCVDRVNGFLEGLGANKSAFDIVAQQDGAAALDASLVLAEDIITAHPDLKAFFCINDPSALGAAAAIKAANQKGQIGVYSIDASPDGKQALLDGEFTAVAAQVPIEIAKYAFNQALDVLDGKTIEKSVYLPSHLVSQEEATKTLNDWQ